MPALRGLRLHDDDLAPALLFVALGAFACLTPAQNDTWWHLRSGQAMWESGAFLTTERFSFTAAGAPLQNHWWLSQLAFYAVWMAGGPFLLTVAAGACALAAVYGSWRLLRGTLEVRVVLLAFLVLATAPEWAVRPQVISLALLVLTAHLIDRERVVWLPAVCLVWGNAHAMVVFGVLMAGACAIEAVLWTRRFFVRDAAITAACIVAPMISPVGLAYWPRVFETVSISRELVLQEYRPPLGLDHLPFWVAAGALGLIVIWRWRTLMDHPRADRILLIGAAGLTVAAATASRNVAFFAVVAAPVLSRLWVGRPEPVAARRGRTRPAGALAYGLVGLAIVAAAAAVTARWRGGGVLLGWQPMSAAVVRAVAECPGRTFNHLEDGGYLMWSLPGRPVFVDSRMEAYPLAHLRRSRSADLEGEYRALFLEHDIACAVVATDSRLFPRLRQDGAVPALVDGNRAVFRDLP